MTIDLSLIVPVYNEEQALPHFVPALKKALASLPGTKEIIFINDGSRDGTAALLNELTLDPEIVVIHFRKNFGQTAAIAAGFDYAHGERIVMLDADMQNDPADILLLLEHMKEYDVLCGWRYNRQDPFLTRILPSRIANWIISCVTGVKLHDYGCSLKIFKKDVAKNLDLHGDMHRFIPALAYWKGATIGEIKVRHHKRTLGKSKYGLSRIIPVILDLITVKFFVSFAKNPMRIFGTMGLGCAGIGTSILCYLGILKIAYHINIWGRPLILLGMLLLILGIQLIAIGLLGELLAKIYYSKTSHSIYEIKEIRSKKSASQ